MPDADEPVWIPVLPDMSGFGSTLTRQLGGVKATADRAGRSIGTGISRGAETGLQDLRDSVSKTAKTQEDAAGRVRVAETKLQELRDSGKAKASQLAAAEEALARAKRTLETATEKAGRATRDLANGQELAKREASQLADEQRDVAESAGVAERMSGKLKAALGGLAAAAGGIAFAAGKDLFGIGATNDRLAAQLDLTGPMSRRAGAVAGRLFRNAYGENLEQVNAAIRGIQTNIGDLGDFSERELQTMGASALDLANIMGEDVDRVTRGVGQLIRNGLAKDATEGFDIITRAAQQLPAEMQGELLDTIEEYSADLGSLGLTGKQAFGAISAAVRAGARNTDLAADGLREFSIRAVDGSKSTIQGFELLGLNAQKMERRIAAGGPSARRATSEVIRALADMDDPLMQEAAGVRLFGTRFEELGIGAIAAMDPMTSKLTEVEGATKKMGDTLNDNFATRMEGWKRTVVGFVQDGLLRIADTGAAAFDWARENKTTVTVFAGVIGGLTAVTVANAIATGVSSGALVTYLTSMRIVTVATRVWTAVQWALNLAMSANPIGLLVKAIALLGVGLVIAYKRSETFRNIVDRAWGAIQRAVSVAWNRGIKPALTSLWRFTTGTLIPVVQYLWRRVIVPAFKAIGAAVRVAWTRVIRPAFAALRGFLVGVVFPVIRFLWRNVVRPTFKLIGFAIKVWWGGVVRPVFMALRAFLTRVVFPVIRFLWNNVVKPVFSGLGKTISNVWRNVVRPVLKALADFIGDTVRPAFKRGVDAIGDIWEGLKAQARRPVEFLVNTVYMKGIRPMMKSIPGVDLPAASFATGGYTGPGAKYQPAGIVHADEFVVNKESRRSLEMRQPGLLDYLNNYGRLPGFAGGGRVWPLPGGAASTYAGHDGVDFNKAGDLGAPFLAAASGTVSSTGYSRGYGNAVFVRGSYGELVYGHALDGSIVVSPGQGVAAGQMLGRVGSTGNSTGPHLHFGFPGGSYGAAMAFLSGAKVTGGFRGKPPAVKKAEDRKDGILDAVKQLPGLARSTWSDITGMGRQFGEWGEQIKNAGVSAIRGAITWGDNKIPDTIVLDNFPDIPMPDNPIRDALKSIGIFDQGGWLQPGGVAINRSSKPEPVFSNEQWGTMRALTASSRPVVGDVAQLGPLRVLVEVQGEVEQDVIYLQGVASEVYRAEARADRLMTAGR